MNSYHSTRSTSWTFQSLAAITGGYWLTISESDSCEMTGVTVLAGQHEDDNLVAVRAESEKGGLPFVALKSLHKTARLRYLLCTRLMVDKLQPFHLPTLVVKDLKQAVIDIGAMARLNAKARVIGITGSAGKTTMTAMLAELLSRYGSVVSTQLSANLPFGIGWNLARIKPATDYAVIEMAIGNMKKNADLVKPNIAVFTNIGAAHLEYHYSTESVALKKSQIFSGMQAGSWVVLNRDMLHWDIVSQQALNAQLNILTFGVSSDADIRLIDYKMSTGEVLAQINGQPITYTLNAPGQHMVLNSLAGLAVIHLLNLDMSDAFSAFKTFYPVQGRGNYHQLLIDQKSITLIDESYNANPISMAMECQHFFVPRFSSIAFSRSSRILSNVAGGI